MKNNAVLFWINPNDKRFFYVVHMSFSQCRESKIMTINQCAMCLCIFEFHSVSIKNHTAILFYVFYVLYSQMQ